MNRIKNLIIPGLFLFLAGCASYSTVNIDVLKPAKITIPVGIAKVVVVDNAYPFQKSDSAVHRINLPGRQYTVDTIWKKDFGKVATKTFAEELEYRQFFDSVYVAEKAFKSEIEGRNPLNPLTGYELDSLCQKYNAQGVISLDYYDYGTTINVVDMPDYFYSTLDARSNTYWTFHNCLTGERLDYHFQRDTIFWESFGSSIVSSVDDLPKIREALEEATYHAGAKYAGFVAPTWTNEERIFYQKGHPLFFEAATEVANNNWDAAKRIWYKVYESSKGKSKARAAFNLALGQEVTGNFMEAAAWGWRSVENYRSLSGISASGMEKDKAVSYYVKLSYRLQEKKKLDEQYGVDQ
ncbi:DUF6340 family protein [Marinilabilia rubra]|uniref:Uncharacterized protein n=1 Tax=Marinilabilia rubra TaxID=2162893 RepID=A0A2U2BC91_9BACT|nr:DUF6340 family protein [Marinilabilia rubra]PWE00680.1 hypothetical protein DDZ16_03545 [Marinilabilia rubra]